MTRRHAEAKLVPAPVPPKMDAVIAEAIKNLAFLASRGGRGRGAGGAPANHEHQSLPQYVLLSAQAAHVRNGRPLGTVDISADPVTGEAGGGGLGEAIPGVRDTFGMLDDLPLLLRGWSGTYEIRRLTIYHHGDESIPGMARRHEVFWLKALDDRPDLICHTV